MLIHLFRYIRGYLKIRVTGYSPERFLNLCKNKSIDVWGLRSENGAYEMYMKVSGFRKLKPILKKTQTKVAIIERLGLPFFFYKYRKRKLFFAGIMLCLGLVYSFTFFVWNIELEGNQSITDNVFLEYLNSQNVSLGMTKKKVDCEKLVKNIREDFDDIIWVSVSLEGTKLHIHVRENTDTFEMEGETDETTPCDIVSDKAGIVRYMITRSGTPLVKVGDEVTEGMVLVSGTVDVLNDAKEVVSHHYVEADADIIIETVIRYEDKIQKQYQEKVYTDKKRDLWFIKVGENSLNLGWVKNKFAHYDVQTLESQLRIGENFYFPIFYGKKRLREYRFETKEYSKTELENLLKKNFNLYCKELEEKGGVLLENQLQIQHLRLESQGSSIIVLQQSVGNERKIVDF